MVENSRVSKPNSTRKKQGILADQYAACMKQMEKILPKGQNNADHACRHLRESLLWCIAEEYCPDQVDLARLYCHSSRKDKKLCAMYMAQIEHCLDRM